MKPWKVRKRPTNWTWHPRTHPSTNFKPIPDQSRNQSRTNPGIGVVWPKNMVPLPWLRIVPDSGAHAIEFRSHGSFALARRFLLPNGQRKFSAFWPAVYWHGCCTFVRSERPTNGTNSPPKLQVEVHWLCPESPEIAILYIQNTHFDIIHFVTMHSVTTDLLKVRKYPKQGQHGIPNWLYLGISGYTTNIATKNYHISGYKPTEQPEMLISRATRLKMATKNVHISG